MEFSGETDAERGGRGTPATPESLMAVRCAMCGRYHAVPSH